MLHTTIIVALLTAALPAPLEAKYRKVTTMKSEEQIQCVLRNIEKFVPQYQWESVIDSWILTAEVYAPKKGKRTMVRPPNMPGDEIGKFEATCLGPITCADGTHPPPGGFCGNKQ